MPISAPPINEATARTLDALLRNETDFAFKRRIPMIVRYLDPQPGERILDLGCGMGFLLRTLARVSAAHLFGLELREETVRTASRELASTNVRLTRGSVLDLPFQDGSLDKIAMTEVLEHLPDEDAGLAEVARVLRPGGTLAISVPNADYPFLWDPLNRVLETLFKTHINKDIWWLAGIWADHERLYSPDQLSSALERAGFDVEEVTAHTHFCIPLQHFLVYGIGKNLVQQKLLPGWMARSADRFRSEENVGSPLNPMNLVHRLLDWVDRDNEGLIDPSFTYVGIVARATRRA